MGIGPQTEHLDLEPLTAAHAAELATYCHAPRLRSLFGSTSFGRGLVLRHHARREPPALTDRDAAVLRPHPDIAAALTGGGRPGRPAGQSPPGPACVLAERRQLLPGRRPRSCCSNRSHTRRRQTRTAPFPRPGRRRLF